ncbi:MAG: RNA polymerase sigma factor [Deltaproteobacteria bacterium]|nr:RNA polymerase sigma factor [Deltaproteobacteria bacterium]
MPANRLDWPTVFREYRGFVYRVVGRLAGPALDHEDIAQDVFVVIFRKLHTLRDPHRLQSWVYGICRRVVAHQRRRLRVRQALAELVGQQPTRPTESGPERVYEQRELERVLYRALDRMSEKRREVLILFALEGLEGKQIAELLEIPLNTVWTRLHAARRDLLGQLGENELGLVRPLREAS